MQLQHKSWDPSSIQFFWSLLCGNSGFPLPCLPVIWKACCNSSTTLHSRLHLRRFSQWSPGKRHGLHIQRHGCKFLWEMGPFCTSVFFCFVLNPSHWVIIYQNDIHLIKWTVLWVLTTYTVTQPPQPSISRICLSPQEVIFGLCVVSPVLLSQSLAPTDLFLVPAVLPVPECHINRIIHLDLWVWLLFLCTTLRFICAVACINSLFLFIAE